MLDAVLFRIKNLQSDLSLGRRSKVIVHDRAIGRILSGRHLGGEGRIGMIVPTHAQRRLLLEEMDGGIHDRWIHLSNGHEIVEDPKATPKCCGD